MLFKGLAAVPDITRSCLLIHVCTLRGATLDQ
jgi:hypothetical protein